MRSLKAVALVVLWLCVWAVATEKNPGIHHVARVSFETAVRVGTTVIPAGEYKVQHAMEGQDHVMTFTGTDKKDVYKVRCTLVALEHKAVQDQQVIEASGNEHVLRELVFRGDRAKHVF